MSNLVIDSNRLWDALMETAKFGGTPDGGIRRLTLGEHDARVRSWLRRQCEALDLTVQVDDVGNMFALRPGRRNDLLPIAMGSHLDTQPTGGKFDGNLGVLAGLEVMRALAETGYVSDAPLMLVNWTNEEGSRFSPAMLGSGIHAGVYTHDFGYGRIDVEGESFGAALDAIGWRGDVRAGSIPLGAMFELHIEQGPILEAENIQIGVVQGVQAMRWFDLVFTGLAAHTGSTPMTMRRNALLGAAQVITGLEQIARCHEGAVGTIGFLSVTPNSHNVIAGTAKATIDIRHPKDSVLDTMEAEIAALIADAARRYCLDASFGAVARVAAVEFDAQCIASVRAGARATRLSTRDIVSGAGHDAAHIAAIAPTTMIFVPSERGLSHNPAESTSQAECAAGAQVLLEAVLDYDRRCAARLLKEPRA